MDHRGEPDFSMSKAVSCPSSVETRRTFELDDRECWGTSFWTGGHRGKTFRSSDAFDSFTLRNAVRRAPMAQAISGRDIFHENCALNTRQDLHRQKN